MLSAVKLVKSSNIDKYKFWGYGIGFDTGRTFSVADGFGRKVITFGADNSYNSSVHVGNKKKYILILDEGPTRN